MESMIPPPWTSIRRHVADVGVVDHAAVERVGRVVLGQRVAADVDVAAVAGLPASSGSGRQSSGLMMALSRAAVEDVVHRHAADGRADRVVAERGDDDRHALLAGRLVARNAQDAELGVGTRIDQRAGGRIDAVVDADDEAGPGVLATRRSRSSRTSWPGWRARRRWASRRSTS